MRYDEPRLVWTSLPITIKTSERIKSVASRINSRESEPGALASNASIPPVGICPGGLFSPRRALARDFLRQAHGVYVLRALLMLKPGLARVPSQVHAFNKQRSWV